MGKNSAQATRNFSGISRVSVNAATYSDVVGRVLRERYSPFRHAAKLLARHARTTPRTAENWLLGRCSPNGESLLNLMIECDELAAEINRVVAEAKAKRGQP